MKVAKDRIPIRTSIHCPGPRHGPSFYPRISCLREESGPHKERPAVVERRRFLSPFRKKAMAIYSGHSAHWGKEYSSMQRWVFSLLFFSYWSLFALQYCVCSSCTAKWISYYVHIYPLFFLDFLSM